MVTWKNKTFDTCVNKFGGYAFLSTIKRTDSGQLGLCLQPAIVITCQNEGVIVYWSVYPDCTVLSG